jgi:hypothetical protein
LPESTKASRRIACLLLLLLLGSAVPAAAAADAAAWDMESLEGGLDRGDAAASAALKDVALPGGGFSSEGRRAACHDSNNVTNRDYSSFDFEATSDPSAWLF